MASIGLAFLGLKSCTRQPRHMHRKLGSTEVKRQGTRIYTKSHITCLGVLLLVGFNFFIGDGHAGLSQPALCTHSQDERVW
jgi:hypothetical protein